MSKSWWSLGFVCLVLPGAVLRADEDPRRILDKAIQAMGGEAKLAKWKAVTFKSSGKFYGFGGDAAPYKGEWALEPPDRCRVSMEGEGQGVSYRFVIVCNGDHGWFKNGDNTLAMDKNQLAEQHQELYEEWITTLLPLKDKDYKLTPLADIQVDRKPAVGFQVSSKGHKDVSLYFDKETGLLVKTEGQIKEQGKDVKQESFLSGYEEIQGIKYPTKQRVTRAGQLFLEGTMTDVKFLEKLEEKALEKP
jgi:outer membrane lipoprotein-sorting protein